MIAGIQPTGSSRTIAVGGGKGGIGKSLIAANLAIAMAQAGNRVILVDGDWGAANQHTLFGIERPGPGLQGFIDHQIDKLSDAQVPTCLIDLTIIPGTTGVIGAANLNYQQKLRVIRHIARLEADVVVIDIGAGVAYNTLDLFGLADLHVVVMTPQLTAMQNAYSFLKGAVHRSIQQLGADAEERAELSMATREGSPSEPVAGLLRRLDDDHPKLAARVASLLTHFGCRLIGNYVFEDREIRALKAMERMIRDYLGVRAQLIGCLRASRKMHASVNDRRPFLLDHQVGNNATLFRQIARILLAENIESLRAGRRVDVEPCVDSLIAGVDNDNDDDDEIRQLTSEEEPVPTPAPNLVAVDGVI